MKKKVSIIVINYNNAKWLNHCLTSIEEQDYPSFEVVLIDDGSKDGSLEIAHFFQEKYDNFVLVEQENHGISYSRNKGVERATGDYLCFVDSDDWIEQGMITALVEAMESEEAIDMVECGYTNWLGSLPFYRLGRKNQVYTNLEALHLLMKNTRMDNYVWAKLFKKERFKGICFPEDFHGCEDVMTVYRYLEKCQKVKTISKRYYQYNMHSGGFTNCMSLAKMEEMHLSFVYQEIDLNHTYPMEHFDNIENYYRISFVFLYELLFHLSKEDVPKNYALPYFELQKVPFLLQVPHYLMRGLISFKHHHFYRIGSKQELLETNL